MSIGRTTQTKAKLLRKGSKKEAGSTEACCNVYYEKPCPQKVLPKIKKFHPIVSTPDNKQSCMSWASLEFADFHNNTAPTFPPLPPPLAAKTNAISSHSISSLCEGHLILVNMSVRKNEGSLCLGVKSVREFMPR